MSDQSQSLERVILPSSVQTLTFGVMFNQSLERVTLPSDLESFGHGLILVRSAFSKKQNNFRDGMVLSELCRSAAHWMNLDLILTHSGLVNGKQSWSVKWQINMLFKKP